MLLGLLSDTHDHREHILKAKKIFADKQTDLVIHLGDYCAGPSVRVMEGMKVLGIYGNNDGDLLSIQRNFGQIGGDFRGQFTVMEIDGLKIACYHGTIAEITEALIDSKRYDIVLTGHTHDTKVETRNGVLAVNPGSAHGFEKKGSIGILDTKTRKVEIIELD